MFTSSTTSTASLAGTSASSSSRVRDARELSARPFRMRGRGRSICRTLHAGFGASLLIGTFVGSLADRLGRKFMAGAYVLTYSLSCLTKHSSGFRVLLVGRILGGTATSLLFSVFESWVVAEHRTVPAHVRGPACAPGPRPESHRSSRSALAGSADSTTACWARSLQPRPSLAAGWPPSAPASWRRFWSRRCTSGPWRPSTWPSSSSSPAGCSSSARGRRTTGSVTRGPSPSTCWCRMQTGARPSGRRRPRAAARPRLASPRSRGTS